MKNEKKPIAPKWKKRMVSQASRGENCLTTAFASIHVCKKNDEEKSTFQVSARWRNEREEKARSSMLQPIKERDNLALDKLRWKRMENWVSPGRRKTNGKMTPHSRE